MSYVLRSGLGDYLLNPTFRPQQNSVGGAARARMVGGFGSSDWFRVQDGLNEPEPMILVGQIWSDRDDAAVTDEITALIQAARTATAVVHGPVELSVDGGAVPTVAHVEKTLYDITLVLWATEDTWRVTIGGGAVPF